MPARAPRLCPSRTCPGHTDGRTCARRRPPHRGLSRQERGLGADHERMRRALSIGRGALCGYCHKRLATTLDHRVPRAQGGPSTLENSVPACDQCHKAKSRRERARKSVTVTNT